MNIPTHHRFFAYCLFIAAILMPTLLFAADFQTISTDDLKAMMDKDTAMVLIDARTSGEYQEAHITKAINVSEKDFETELPSLPQDRNFLLVFYCNGVKCGKSKKVAAKAAKAGYTNILVYAEGFPVWEEKGFPIVAGPEYGKKIETTKLKPAEVQELILAKADDYVLVDVRDEAEFNEGHIPTAINIPVETFASRSGDLPKEKAIIVYCNSGGRSYNAYRKLMKLAYPKIFQAIFADWKEAGLPVEM